MNILQLKEKIDKTIMAIKEDGHDLADINTWVMVEFGPERFFSDNPKVLYDDFGSVSGVVIYGEHGGPKCPGFEIEAGVYSGCNQSHGDCPICGK